MKVRSIEDYLTKANLKAEDVFTKEEANQIVNEQVIAVYQGRVNLRAEKMFTGFEIAEALHNIEKIFSDAIKKACGEEVEDDEDDEDEK